MTGPYERELETRELPLTTGQIKLRCGGTGITATLLGGDAQITLVEKFDDAVVTFGVENPVRFVNHRQTLRLVVEATLDNMTIKFDQPG